MAKHVIDEDSADPIVVADSNSDWTLAEGTLLTGGVGIQNYGNDFVHFTISGKINSSYAALQALAKIGTDDYANATSLVVTAKADLYGAQSGLELAGTDTSLKNAGKISSSQSAIRFSHGDVVISNSGEITADLAAIRVSDATTCAIRNSGHIARASDGTAVSIEADIEGRFINGASGVVDGAIAFSSTGDSIFRNNGIVRANDAAMTLSVALGTGDDSLINRGRIAGDIYLGAGDDIADLRKGKLVNSAVFGDDGDDVFILDNASILVEEMDGQGSDTIKATVSYVLANGQDVEILEAIGKKNIDLTGNDAGNVLRGNIGNNALSGGGDNDILAGFGGKDMLTGGAGADHFFFYTNSGVGTITDFTVNMDVIHIVEIPGIDDFTDLQSRMSSMDFDDDNDIDTVIDLGGGSRIRLTDVAKGDLEMSDFSIFPA